ncbi:MAG: DNA recombination protein RmuC, partial [Nocardioidaceae bacterium]
PDMVVNLAGGKHVVVDSKVPLDAFLDAGQTDDEDEQLAHLRRHARQVRGHVDALAAKSYWKQFDQAPEFVVLFVPGESFLSHALEVEPTLLEYASAKRVVLATPTTLIALLRTVAYAWTQSRLADNAREIHSLARELYDRIGTVGDHLDKVGRSLTGAVSSYNGAIASLESRVLVSARKLADLHVSDDELGAPRAVEQSVRPLTAPELVEPPGNARPPQEADAPAARRAG